jgi:Undecaprenyl-phosphate glucose phosphotransferase
MSGTEAVAETFGPEQRTRLQFRYAATIIPGIVMLSDFGLIILAAIVSYAVWVPYNTYTLEHYIFAASFVVFVSIILLDRAELYEISAIMGPIWRFDGLLISIGTSFLFFLSIAFSFNSMEIYSDRWLVSFATLSFLGTWVSRSILRSVFQILGERGLVGRSIALLGTGEQAKRFLAQMNRVKPHFTHFAGLFETETTPALVTQEVLGHRVAGDLDGLIEAARLGQVNDIVIAMPWSAEDEITAVTERLKELPVNVFVSMDLVGFQLDFRPTVDNASNLPMFEVVHKPISGWNSILKRIEDLTLGIGALIALSPLLVLIAILIKIDSPGPVFFRQARLGFNNKHFDIYKFRSMYHRDIPEKRVKQASRGDPRITRVGRFIRRTSIDELPQLFNVIGGSMSLVGPRPHALSHNEEFSEKVRGYFARHRVKPGITGWAQVNGLRGETDTLEKITARTEHDIYYTDNWSLVFDFRILMLTVVSVLFHKEAY